MSPQFREAIRRLLRGRIILFALPLFLTLPLAAVSPLFWTDPTVSPWSAGGYTTVFGGLAIYYMYGLVFNWRLRVEVEVIPINTVAGVARKRWSAYRAPLRVGGQMYTGPVTSTLGHFLVIDKVTYTVPLYEPFDVIPEERPIRLTFVELGGPLVFKMRRIVLQWEEA